MAAEIALAECSTKSSLFLKSGIALLGEDQHVPRQVTELAGAIGTSLILDGSHKRGKKLFRQSMLDPTNNALAQAEWASEALGDHLVSETLLKRLMDAKEARARHALSSGNFEEAYKYSLAWIDQEPFSSLAYAFAVVSANITENFKASEELARKALLYFPRSASFKNTMAFAIASQAGGNDRLTEAEKYLRAITNSDDPRELLVAEANRGLIAFRRGGCERRGALRQSDSRFSAYWGRICSAFCIHI